MGTHLSKNNEKKLPDNFVNVVNYLEFDRTAEK